MLPCLTLVLGGAASGKSVYAENLVTASGKARTYIATAEAHDTEMHEKIETHRARRGPDWKTVEAPRDLRPALAAAGADDVVLIDCATMWLTHHLLAENDLSRAEADLLDALALCAAPVVVVSGEVGLSVVPENALARRFQTAQGRLNQTLAGRAEVVVNVIAGLPQILKGQLP